VILSRLFGVILTLCTAGILPALLNPVAQEILPARFDLFL
jgi:hypothetical protein